MSKTSPQTKRGYDLYELASALQKDIRRGKEYEAVFWAAELESINKTWLWDRLRVIASEDIGIAGSALPVLIETLRKQYFETEDDERRLFLVHAVIALAKCKKSRMVDDLLNVVYGEIQFEDNRLKIPDYAIDKHTRRGKEVGRGWDHFFAEGSKLANETTTYPNTYTERAKEILKKHGSPKSKPKKQDQQSTDTFLKN
jgi:replication-associated recombination protein RarA